MDRASSWSWVTKMKVIPVDFWIFFSSCCMSLRSFKSNAPRGSSSSRTLGWLISARAMATRCCCPPERLVTRRLPKPESITKESISLTFSLISFLGTCFSRRGKAMFSNTFRWGNRAYFWNTVLTFRLWGGTSLMHSPIKITSPWSGWVKPPMSRSVVVFPQPEGPSRVINSLS